MKLLGKGGNKMYGFRLVACLFALATPFWANAQSQCSFNYDLTFEKYGNLYGSPAQALQAAKFTYFGPSGTYIQLPDLRTPPYLGSYYSLELSLLAAGGSGHYQHSGLWNAKPCRLPGRLAFLDEKRYQELV